MRMRLMVYYEAMENLTILDGGMGTLLQAKGLQNGETPEDWNVERPDDVAEIHRAYLAAGSNVIYANTFGANKLKYHGRHTLEEVVRSGIENAVRAADTAASETGRRARVALDLGPTGRLLKPAGDLAFEEAVSAFAETIRLALGTSCSNNRTIKQSERSNNPRPDLIVIETMGDVRELKAAVMAAKENCDLPVYATVTLGADGKLLTGGNVECVAALLESLNVDAYGFNCGLGPDQMISYVKRLSAVSTKPIIVKPNAGLPKVVEGKTVFSVGPEEFADAVGKLVDAGASVVGGCCGTTPQHVGALFRLFDCSDRLIKARTESPRTIVSSGTSVVELKSYAGLIIGERINPTGKKLLKEAYAKGDTAYVLREAVKQIDADAEILDVNCGVPGLDEAALIESTVESVQGVATCPLQLDTADPQALERALRRVNGKPLVNSVNGKRTSMDAVFPLVKKYGGAIVALCLDENGIPPTSEGRLEIARRILEEGAKYGFSKRDFVFDALTLAVSADPNAAIVTLETVRRLTEELGVNTVLGVSNVSFGLPNRPVLNNAMYALAKRAGLSAAIANPSVIRDEIDPAAEDVLLGRDPNCAKWIERSTEAQRNSAGAAVCLKSGASQADSTESLCLSVKKGLRDDARQAAEAALSSGKSAMDLINGAIVPALEEVGRGFEKGTVFLPQLLMAADAAGEAFGVVKRALSSAVHGSQGQSTANEGNRTIEQSNNPNNSPIVIATVKGDIHDIGKNIVRALLENYGFEVIDLGRDVPPETIVDTARKSKAMMVGLSALMTTTVGAMAETIRQVKAAGLPCRTCVGGAVVTQEYADEIGADYYAKDAMKTVRIAETLAGRKIG